jgi:diguanylate cyclase (GGDEF)-like protein
LLLSRIWTDPRLNLHAWVPAEICAQRWAYLYTGIGTVVAFGAMGFVWGRRQDLLAGRAKSLEDASRRLEKLSVTDGLTGLYVHRHLVERLDEEIKRSRRYDYPLACLFIDVDDFKAVNERHGHGTGDRVLSAIGSAVLGMVRDTDVAGRYGGDEIVVILPQIGEEQAFAVAERIRRRVEALSIAAEGRDARVTASVGVFVSKALPDAPSRLFEIADEALRRSKRGGKNRTTVFTTGREGARNLQVI